MEGEYALPKGAQLGVYSLQVVDYGGSSFRVEEYKKPEFEVTVQAPKEPVQLGDKITATIQAKYFFGARSTTGKVKYKVLRSSHNGRWYPPRPLGLVLRHAATGGSAPITPGIPAGTAGAACRPSPWWWGGPQPQPEVVAEREVEIGPDGTIVASRSTRCRRKKSTAIRITPIRSRRK